MKIAATSSCRFRHGAVIVKGGRVIAVGVNTHRNHPCVVTSPKNESSFHAEIMALRALQSEECAKGADIYIARIGWSEGEPRLSKPCSICHAALINAGIRKIYYTT